MTAGMTSSATTTVTTSATPRTLTVALQPAYPVHVSSGLLRAAHEHIREKTVVVVTDENVARLHAPTLVESLTKAGRVVHLMTVPPGEDSKSIAVWGGLLSRMAELALGRDCAVAALGGGVVGDLAGFVAASYLRGVAFYQLPTTLLAMVDSSVGGKTGVDLPQGKNLVGAFWQPRAVLADVSTLATLPEREFRQGTVEFVKHGYLANPSHVEIYKEDWTTRTEPERLGAAILANVKVKADVVVADERESGVRATLNLGHTLAHALETVGHHDLHHGEAVAVGLVFAGALGAALERIAPEAAEHHRTLVAGLGLPTEAPGLTASELT
ncbi:MAG: 3-dehydroquinate synthase, partial [Trueperaceae bacterium]|nr:3-dehydroquinate synthase [Trueperaceae bacterium]